MHGGTRLFRRTDRCTTVRRHDKTFRHLSDDRDRCPAVTRNGPCGNAGEPDTQTDAHTRLAGGRETRADRSRAMTTERRAERDYIAYAEFGALPPSPTGRARAKKKVSGVPLAAAAAAASSFSSVTTTTSFTASPSRDLRATRLDALAPRVCRVRARLACVLRA